MRHIVVEGGHALVIGGDAELERFIDALELASVMLAKAPFPLVNEYEQLHEASTRLSAANDEIPGDPDGF